MKTINYNTAHFSGIRLLAILYLFLCSIIANAQDAPKYPVKLKLVIKDGDMKNALITITKDGAPFKVIDPDGGKYTVDLDFGAEYLFTCTKMGYITKALIIDTHVPKDREQEDFAKQLPTVTLEKQPADQIVTYTQPVGKIKYSVASGDFDFDRDYSQNAQVMQKKAEANPTPAPKPPAPNPKPVVTPPPPPPPTPPSNPIPVVVKQPEYKPEPEKPKPVVKEPEVPQKVIVKNKVEKVIQEDRRKITIITVNIDGTDYVYKKEEYTWGGLYFYKDGRNITERTYEKETE